MVWFEVFLPAKDPSLPNVTLTVEAQNWIGALRTGLSNLGEGHEAIANVMCDIKEDNSIHVTDVATRRVFRLREVPAPSTQKPAAASLPPEATMKMSAAAGQPRPISMPEIPRDAVDPLDQPLPGDATIPETSVPWTKMPPPVAPVPTQKVQPASTKTQQMFRADVRPAPAPPAAPTPRAPQHDAADFDAQQLTVPEQTIPVAPKPAAPAARAPTPVAVPAPTPPRAPTPVAVPAPAPAVAARAPTPVATPAARAPTPAAVPAPTAPTPAAAPAPKPAASSMPHSFDAQGQVPAGKPAADTERLPRARGPVSAPTPRGTPAPPPKRKSGQFDAAPQPASRETSVPAASAQPIGRSAEKVNAQAVADALADVFDATQELLLESDVEPRAIAEKLLDIALQHIPAESGSFYLADLNGHELTFAAVRGPKASEIMRKKLTVKVGQGIVGFCALEGVCLSISDLQRDPRYFSAVADAIGYSPKDTLCASAEHDGRLFGALQLINSRAGFTAAHMEVLRYIGLTAASLLERHADAH